MVGLEWDGGGKEELEWCAAGYASTRLLLYDHWERDCCLLVVDFERV